MDKNKLSFLIEEGFTIKKIANELGCSQTNVRHWLKKYNLKTKRGPHGKKTKDTPDKRYCSRCGETNINKFYGHKTKICAHCQNQYNIEKGREKKAYMRQKLGGKCVNCGFEKYQCSLDVHHLDPIKKDVAFRTARGWTYDRIDKEIEDCILLCKNCHAAIHCNLLIIKSGSS